MQITNTIDSTRQQRKIEVTITNLLRWIHVLAGSDRIDEVLVVNFALVPIHTRLEHGKRGCFFATIFPRIFRLASVFALTTIFVGGVLT